MKVDDRLTKDTRSRILRLIKGKEFVSMADFTATLGISRQAVHKHLKKMIREGKVLQTGATRGALYRYAGRRRPVSDKQLKRRYSVSGLQEDRIFEESDLWLNLNKELGKISYETIRYAFSEMLNNVIDHSESEKCLVEWQLTTHDVSFRIRDFGIGLFYSIEAKLGLSSESEALGELIKGKTTTMKERHTGEGIFFTARAGDRITFDSHRIQLAFDNQKKDVSVAERHLLGGTEVFFQISRRSKRKLEDLFAEFAPGQYEYRFEKTNVRVELLQPDFVSRSEARRLLRGLEKFGEVILDFRRVKSIGQAFADEIFRVFRNAHPSLVLRAHNTNPVVDTMIRHVQKQQE